MKEPGWADRESARVVETDAMQEERWGEAVTTKKRAFAAGDEEKFSARDLGRS